MRKIVLLSAFLCFASLCWSQYRVDYQTGITDNTTYCMATGHNCWKVLPGNGLCVGAAITMGADGIAYCISPGDFSIWSFNVNATGWNRITAMGLNARYLSAADSGHIYSLQVTAYCTGQNEGFGIFKWTGSAWTQPNANMCLNTISVGFDGTVAGAKKTSKTIWVSNDGGATYSQPSGLVQWTQYNSADANNFCGVNGGTLMTQTGSQAWPVAFSPSPGTIIGCAMNLNAPDQEVLLVWNGTTVKSFDFTAGTWSTLPGLNPLNIVLYGRGSVIAVDPAGHIFHWNVYSGAITATLSGSQNCPVGVTCQPTTYHDGSVQVVLPHGRSHATGTAHVLWNSAMNTSSMDYSEFCDPLFGAPNDPECTAALNSSVICEASGVNFFGGGQAPSLPPPIKISYSVDGRGYNGSISYTSTEVIPGGLRQYALCGMTDNACAPATAPSCPTYPSQKLVRDTCHGGPATCNQAILEGALLAGCQARDIARGGAWMILQDITQVGGETLCTGYLYFFKGTFPVQCK